MASLLTSSTDITQDTLFYQLSDSEIVELSVFRLRLSGPHAIFIWRIAVAHDVGHSQKPPSNFFHGRAGFPSHFLALITLKTFERIELITPTR